MHKGVILVVAVTVIAIIGFFNHGAYAVSYDIKDQASCQSLPSGSPSWNSAASICTVTNISLTLNNGDSLTIECCSTLTTNGGTITINSGGTLSNFGNIQNLAGSASVTTSASITNNGTITNSGSINNGGPIYNSGTISNLSHVSNSGGILNFG